VIEDNVLRDWAATRADDAGRLARELVEARDRNRTLEAALGDLLERLNEIADAIKPPRRRGGRYDRTDAPFHP